MYPARLTSMNERTSRGVNTVLPDLDSASAPVAPDPMLGLAPIWLARATLMVTVTRRIAFSCTCHPARNEANADKTTEPIKRSNEGFLKTEIKLGICNKTVIRRVCCAVMVGRTPKAVSPTRPRVVAERAAVSRERFKYCPKDVLETSTIMMRSANEYRAQKLAAQYEWVRPRLNGNRRPAS